MKGIGKGHIHRSIERKQLFDPDTYHPTLDPRPEDQVDYNDSYAAQKTFRGIPKLEATGRNLRYWISMVKTLMSPVPRYNPRILLHHLAVSAANHAVLSDMIQSEALRASEARSPALCTKRASSGLQRVMQTLQAQIGTQKQMQSQRFRKFWTCHHKPATIHHRAWGLFISDMSAKYESIKSTLGCNAFFDQLVTVIDAQYHKGVYQGLIDRVQDIITRYNPCQSNTSACLAEIITAGKDYERVRTFPPRQGSVIAGRGSQTSKQRPNPKRYTPFPDHRPAAWGNT